MSLLIGQMLKEFSNNISYGSTMAKIFTEVAKTCKWRCFHKQVKKKKMTLIQLLTMTSGSHDCYDDVIRGVKTRKGIFPVVLNSFHMYSQTQTQFYMKTTTLNYNFQILAEEREIKRKCERTYYR